MFESPKVEKAEGKRQASGTCHAYGGGGRRTAWRPFASCEVSLGVFQCLVFSPSCFWKNFRRFLERGCRLVACNKLISNLLFRSILTLV